MQQHCDLDIPSECDGLRIRIFCALDVFCFSGAIVNCCLKSKCQIAVKCIFDAVYKQLRRIKHLIVKSILSNNQSALQHMVIFNSPNLWHCV